MDIFTEITFRKATPDDAVGIAEVHLLVQKQAYDGLIPPAYLSASDFPAVVTTKREKLQLDRQGQTCTFLSEDNNGQIIAYASGGPRRDGPETYSGELYNIFVLSEYQNRGVGSELFLRVVEFLIEQGHSKFLLWVIRDTAATAYYRHLQGVLIAKREITINVPLTMDCYGWNNLIELYEMLKLQKGN